MVNWAQIKSKIPPPLRNKYILTTSLFLLWVTLFDENSVINCVESKMELRRMKQEKAHYEQQLKITTDILQELRFNNDSLEKFARERYGFHNPDEDVFVVVE
jgi:cell division protein FtsB